MHIIPHLLHLHKSDDDDDIDLHLNFSLISAACQQGCSTPTSSFSIRFVIFTALLFSYLICNIFTATIISDLWANAAPIKNLEMLLSHSNQIYMSKDSDVSKLVTKGMSQYAPHLLPKIRYHDLSTAFWKVARSEDNHHQVSCLLAWPDYLTGSGRKLLQEKYKNVDKELCKMFSSFPYKPFPMKVSMFVKKDSPFTPILNYRIAVGLERGLISRYWKQYERNTKLGCVGIGVGTDQSDGGKVLEMLDVVLAFFILIAGFATSLTVLLVERSIWSGVKWYHLCNQI